MKWSTSSEVDAISKTEKTEKLENIRDASRNNLWIPGSTT